MNINYLWDALTIIQRYTDKGVPRNRIARGGIHTDQETYIAFKQFAKDRGIPATTMSIILINLGMYLFMQTERAMAYYKKRKEEALKGKRPKVDEENTS